MATIITLITTQIWEGGESSEVKSQDYSSQPVNSYVALGHLTVGIYLSI